MTESGGGPSHSDQQQPGNGLAEPNPDSPRDVLLPFVCFLPCTKPSIKYLDSLDGCASGIHATREDIQDLQVLYGKMADAIMAKDGAAVEASSESGILRRAPDPCSFCLDPIVPSPTRPMLYLENCTHYYHYECYLKWQDTGRTTCPHCRVISSRALLWPQPFPNAAAKNEIIQLQKRCFGLYLAPETILTVSKFSFVGGGPSFDLTVRVGRKGDKCFTVRKRPSQRLQARPAPQLAMFPFDSLFDYSEIPLFDEEDLRREIELLHLADQPRAFYLADILPLEEHPKYRAKCRSEILDESEKRQRLLFQFRCPFNRLTNIPDPNRRTLHCSEGYSCEFWHGWPDNTPVFMVERVKFRDFPRFFCMKYSRSVSTGPKCIECIRVHSQDLVYCSAGIHPSTQDLKDMDGLAHKMAKQIMAPVIAPEPLVCAYCHKTAEPNSAWIHMQNCDHCLHVHCHSTVRRDNSKANHKVDLPCPACNEPSGRTIVWPGPFPSDMMKKAILKRQLEQFKIKDHKWDIELEIVQLASGHSHGRPLPKLADIFTVDYGGPSLIIINAATTRNNSTIYYD